MTQDAVSPTISLDAFGLEARPIQDVDLRALHALSASVSWPYRSEDWAFFQSFGDGLAAVDGLNRVHATGMWFPFGAGFGTIGALITVPPLQAKGGGAWLARHMMRRAGTRALGLHATRASHHMFCTLGFRDECPVSQHQGIAAEPPRLEQPAGDVLRPLVADDLGGVGALDLCAFGAERTALIRRLSARGEGVVLTRSGKIAAYAIAHKFGRGVVIGPVVAKTDEDAMLVCQPLIASRQGRFVRVDSGAGGVFRQFLMLCGLVEYDRVTRMSFGRRWPLSHDGRATTYALATQSIG